MTFSEVSDALYNGKKVKLRNWNKAYWYCDKDHTIINHEPNGDEFPIGREPIMVLVCMAIDDWEIMEDEPSHTGFTFDVALDELKEGKRLARRGWNENNQFVVYCKGNTVPARCIKVKAAKNYYILHGSKNDMVTISPHLDMKAADGSYNTGWVPTQTDMLADDWYVVE